MYKRSLYVVLSLLLGLTASAMAAKPYQQDGGADGIISMEAEHFDESLQTTRGEWEEVGPTGGFTGTAGMQCNGAGVIKTGYAATSPGLAYNINFVKAGTHYVWVLAWGATGNDDSCHVGLDGQEVTTGEWMSGWSNVYVWSSSATVDGRAHFDVDVPGEHTLNIWVREDGLIIDKIVVTTNVDYVPEGDGPPESPRGLPESAIMPNPPSGAIDVRRDVVLSWEAGASAATHDVYFGTVLEDVTNASRTNPLDVLVGQGQDANTYDPPGLLEIGQTYYWRIDEVNAPPDSTIVKGDVWSFTAEPLIYRMTNVTAIASSSNAGVTPDNTVNGSGLDGDLHSMVDTTMWLSAKDGPQPTWIQYEFDGIYKLQEMWVWNYNVMVEPILGFGVKDVTIEYSVDGTDWTSLGDQQFTQAAATDGYAHNTTVDFGGVAAKYVRLTIHSNWASLAQQYGLSEVRFFYIPANPREPKPASGATGVNPGVVLSWRAGREAATHEVYFSEDMQAVADGTALVATAPQNSYDPASLNIGLGTTYYWKVVEVNQAETPSAWPGAVWSFSTLDFFVIDNFESYTNDSPNRVFQTWIDGLGFSPDEFFPDGDPGNGSGAIVGYDPAEGDIMETTVFHGGRQSMPVEYDNTGQPNYSEATRTWATPQNWALNGADTLRVCFRGGAIRFAETVSGTITMSGAGADIFGATDQFTYAWKSLSGDGSIIVRVDSVEQTDVWAKAGVMIRDSLNADARNAMAYVTPDGRVGWQFRTVTFPDSESTRSEPNTITLPHWVRLTREGVTIRADHSSDGENWLPMVEETDPTSPTSLDIGMNTNIYIGLAVTSHAPGVTCTAEFSNVQTGGGVSGSWEFSEIGTDQLVNDRGDVYVTVKDKNGGSATVTYPDGTIMDEWQVWDIPFSALTGVNMANVTTMSIGVDDRNKPQKGAGTLFIDDIGFGRPAD
jgi:regulation of enolase protein 1 (concanavalin A-like superfamily)